MDMVKLSSLNLIKYSEQMLFLKQNVHTINL